MADAATATLPEADAGALPPLETVSPSQALEALGEPSEVNPRAVAASAGTPAPAAAAAPASGGVAPVDKKGQPFDPAKHECTLDGQPIRSLEGVDVARLVPVMNKDGKLRLRSYVLPEFRSQSRVVDPAAPPPAAEGAPVPPPAPAGQPVPPAAPVASDAEIKATAQTFAALQLMVMRSALGTHVATEKEHSEALVSAWEAVARHYGVGFTHPLLGLGLVTGGVVLAAMQHPEHGQKTTGALVGWWHRVRHWAYGLWIRTRHGRAAPRRVDPEPVAAAPTHGERARPVSEQYAWPPLNA